MPNLQTKDPDHANSVEHEAPANDLPAMENLVRGFQDHGSLGILKALVTLVSTRLHGPLFATSRQ